MTSAAESAASVLFMLLLGKLLALKLPKGGAHAASIKDLVLTALLPSTIFLSLAVLSIKPDALAWPALALFANLANFVSYRLALGALLPQHLRGSLTAICLPLCSFAPGLSSFAFVIEFTASTTKGLVAFADFGNKIYGILLSKLICLWLIRHGRATCPGRSKKIAGVSASGALSQLLSEPITVCMVAGLACAGSGFSLEDLGFINMAFSKVAAATSPVLLLFIGLKLKLEPSLQTLLILLVLLMRAGINLLLAGAINYTLEYDTDQSIGWLLFLQSAASFWPYGSMQSFSDMEKAAGLQRRTFNLEAALSFITLSFPFSIAMCVGISLGSSVVAPPQGSAIVGLCMLVPGLLGAAVVGRMGVRWPGDLADADAPIVPSKEALGASCDLCTTPGSLGEAKEAEDESARKKYMLKTFIHAVVVKQRAGETTML